MTPTPSHVDTDELIETLERLEKEATPGPWTAKRIDYEVYGVDVSFEIRATRKNPVLQTIMVERYEVAAVHADWANCQLVAAMRNHLPAILSALKENERLREALEPFAAACAKADLHADEVKRAGMGTVSDSATPGWGIRYGHLKAARAALQPQGEK